jgi:amino acid adenylation domain-containing protein
MPSHPFVPPSQPSSFTEVVRRRAELHGERPAFTFLADGEREAARLSYAALDAAAQAVAAELQARGLAGERALLLFPPGLDFVAAFLGCLYAGVVAVPAYPPRPGRSGARLAGMLRDASPRAALTTAALLPRVAREVAATATPLATDTLAAALADRWRPPALRSSDLAFLQYTSGSTAAPKGVMVTHANLLANEAAIARAFAQSEESVVVGWLPLYHDMGLIGNVLQPLWSGGSAVLMAPLAFLQRPRRWLAAIGRYRATTSGGPDFAYALCAARLPPAERAGLDLTSWRVAFDGAEPVRAETLDRFAEEFAPCGFRREAFLPCYGLAEATLFVAGAGAEEAPVVREVDGSGGRRRVGCGQPAAGIRVVIVEPESRTLQPPGREGEIWVAGPGVAAGYWGRPEETADTFHGELCDPARERRAAPHPDPSLSLGMTVLGEGAGSGGDGGPWLRTGDLGIIDAAGELFVTGRRKDLIIVRGRNHYPHDLEQTVEGSHPAARPAGAAAFAVEAGGEERLVVACEVERRLEAEAAAVVAAARRALVEAHEVAPHAVVAIRAGALPRTSSGKVRRGACREAYLAGSLPLLAAGAGAAGGAPSAGVDEPAGLEMALPARAELLALAPAARRRRLADALAAAAAAAGGGWGAPADPDSPLALDSLQAVALRGRVAAALEVELPLAALLAGVTPRALAADVAAGLEAVPGPAPQGPRPSPTAADSTALPLSHGQRALWLLHRLAPASPAYNVALAARLRPAAGDAVDFPSLRRAAARLAARHPALRVTFQAAAGKPVQQPLAGAGIDFAEVAAEAWPPERLAEAVADAAWRPFDLERGPLLRVSVFRTAPGDRAPDGEAGPVLVLAAHHIAVDFWSLELLLDDLGRLLAGEEPPPPRLTYADFVRWQGERLEGAPGELLWDFWRQALDGAPPRLELPSDRQHSAAPVAARGVAACAFAIPAEITGVAARLAAASGGTLFAVLLTAFQALLARFTGAEDLVVGAPAAGRTRPGFEEVVGYFANLLPLRARLAGDPSFRALAAATARTVVAAVEHQDLPFPLLVERLRPERGAGAPLVQAVLAYEAPRRLGGEGAAALTLGLAGEAVRVGPLVLEPVPLPRRAAPFEMVLVVGAGGAGLTAVLELDAAHFDMTTAARLAGHFQTLLAAAVTAPERRLSELPLLTPAERAQLVVEWNDTAVRRPEMDRPLHELVTRWAAATPQAPAVAWRLPDGGERRLSYAELTARADRLAGRLRALGAGPEAPVAILLERSPELLVAILAALAAGGAFAPLDPAHPRDRLAFVLADCGAPVVVTTGALAGRLPAGPWWRVLVEDGLDGEPPGLAATPGAAVGRAPSPETAAYVLYTSGSTGRPKGVVVPHGAAVNMALQGAADLELAPGRRLLQVASFAFDAAVLEVFACWAAGGTLCLARPEATLSGPLLADDLEALAVHAVILTPSVLDLLPERPFPALEIVSLGGELVSAPLAARWSARHLLRNDYGPTEAAVYVTTTLCPPGAAAPPSIGRPIGNGRVYVLDRALEPVPIGVPGELCAAGAGVARGYLGRPELTAERFVPDPFGEAGGRLYRTGDRARLRPDGQVDFLGRLDDQVKVRGVRVEPGEVAAVLREHAAVRAAAVVARRSRAGETMLAAYVVPAGAAPPDLAPALRAFLAARLPEPFVPAVFVPLPALPVTSTGKLDVRALPAAEPTAARRGGAPRGELERTIAAIWSELLGVEQVGIADNFFELGGHSLLMARAQAAVSEALGRQVPLVALFNHPTVASLAAHLDQDGARAGGGRDAAVRPEPQERAATRRAAMAGLRRARAAAGGAGGER